MKNIKRATPVFAAILIICFIMQLLPTKASATSSSEIRSQINALKEERTEIKDKIADIQNQYEENENEILDIVAKKNTVDQEIQLLNEQIMNINEQSLTFNAVQLLTEVKI